jgi:hypothetical protein
MRSSVLHVGLVSAVLLSSGLGWARETGEKNAHGWGKPSRDAAFIEDSARLPPSAALKPAGTSTAVSLGDVDGDGDLDMFLPQGTASIDARPNLLWLNDGSGHFSDVSSSRLPQGQDANSTKAEFVDVDADGDLDVLISNVGPEQLLLNDGHGAFSDASASLPAPLDLFSDISAGLHVADLTGDGCPDALIANENPFDPNLDHGAQNRYWIGDCAGHFTDVTDLWLPAATDQTAGFVSGDIDADGDVDVIVLDRGQERVYVNDGTGRLLDETSARFPMLSDSTRGGALVDLDGDGDLDLVTSNSRGEPPRLYLNSGAGRFTERPFGYTEAADETDTTLQLVDLNGDRFPDLYIGNAGRFDSGHGFEGGADHFFENHHGHFREASVEHVAFPIDQATLGAAFGDLDGDGDVDFIVAAAGDSAVGLERLFIRLGSPRACSPKPSHPR